MRDFFCELLSNFDFLSAARAHAMSLWVALLALAVFAIAAYQAWSKVLGFQSLVLGNQS